MMNAITNNQVFSQITGASVQGVENTTSAIPFANSFATLLSGMIDPQSIPTQNSTSHTATIDALLAQIDQLLAQLTNNEGDQPFSEELLDEALLSETALPMMSLPALIQMLDVLVGVNGNQFAEQDIFSAMATDQNSLSLLNTQFLSLFGGDSMQNSNATSQQMHNIALSDQQTQQQLLQSLKMTLNAAKEGNISITKDELGKLSQLLEQLAPNHGQKLELLRVNSINENKSQVYKGFIAQNLARVVAPIGENIVNQSGSQLMQQEQSSSPDNEITNHTVTKIGFHQLMIGNLHSTNPSAQVVETNQPVVRAQHFQSDMNDFLVRQLQMTRFPNGVSEATIKLFPENLGTVDVKLTIQQGILTALFMAETSAGKELLESQLATLRASLLSTGLQVEKLEVNLPHSPNNGHAQDTMHRQGQSQREHQPQTDDAYFEDEPDEDFSTVFEHFSQAI